LIARYQATGIDVGAIIDRLLPGLIARNRPPVFIYIASAFLKYVNQNLSMLLDFANIML